MLQLRNIFDRGLSLGGRKSEWARSQNCASLPVQVFEMCSAQGSILLRVLAFGALLVACGAYDADLLKPQETSLQRGSAQTGSGDPSAADGGGLDPDARAAGVSLDPDALTRCGDGRVSGVEKCDIAIAAGAPGACPTECPALEKCVPRVLNGTACQAQCELRPILCQSGDGCCSGYCTQANDSDCSPSCGDGVLQPPETCEDGSSVPCKKSDAECDDADPCTTDMRMGTTAACNVTCAHVAISAPKPGDGCCPKAADANSDSDCQPRCGNQVREAGEECDGGEGCSQDCKLTLQPDQLQCLAAVGDDACKRCACVSCTKTELDCWAGSDQDANTKCSAMLDCSHSMSCFLDDCYCGTNTSAACLLLANGVCKMQVEVAAGTSDPIAIGNLKNDASTTLGKAYAADQCRVMQCRDSCRASMAQ